MYDNNTTLEKNYPTTISLLVGCIDDCTVALVDLEQCSGGSGDSGGGSGSGSDREEQSRILRGKILYRRATAQFQWGKLGGGDDTTEGNDRRNSAAKDLLDLLSFDSSNMKAASLLREVRTLHARVRLGRKGDNNESCGGDGVDDGGHDGSLVARALLRLRSRLDRDHLTGGSSDNSDNGNVNQMGENDSLGTANGSNDDDAVDRDLHVVSAAVVEDAHSAAIRIEAATAVEEGNTEQGDYDRGKIRYYGSNVLLRAAIHQWPGERYGMFYHYGRVVFF